MRWRHPSGVRQTRRLTFTIYGADGDTSGLRSAATRPLFLRPSDEPNRVREASQLTDSLSSVCDEDTERRCGKLLSTYVVQVKSTLQCRAHVISRRNTEIIKKTDHYVTYVAYSTKKVKFIQSIKRFQYVLRNRVAVCVEYGRFPMMPFFFFEEIQLTEVGYVCHFQTRV